MSHIAVLPLTLTHKVSVGPSPVHRQSYILSSWSLTKMTTSSPHLPDLSFLKSLWPSTSVRGSFLPCFWDANIVFSILLSLFCLEYMEWFALSARVRKVRVWITIVNFLYRICLSYVDSMKLHDFKCHPCILCLTFIVFMVIICLAREQLFCNWEHT